MSYRKEERILELPHLPTRTLLADNRGHLNRSNQQWENTPTLTKLEGFRSRRSTNFQVNTQEQLTEIEIKTVMDMLKNLEVERSNFTAQDDPKSMLKNLEQDSLLRNHLLKLRNKLNLLQWRTFASHSKAWLFNLDPIVVDRLLDIQRETAQSTGALAALGGSLSLSILYSATRGNMWPFFVSWWLFVISLAVTSALATSTSATSSSTSTDLFETYSEATVSESSMDSLSKPTTRNWLLRRLSVLAVFISLTCSVGGWAALAAGVGSYSLTNELQGNSPSVTAGPSLGVEGERTWAAAVTYVLIGLFGGAMIGAYLYRLRLFSKGWRMVENVVHSP